MHLCLFCLRFIVVHFIVMVIRSNTTIVVVVLVVAPSPSPPRRRRKRMKVPVGQSDVPPVAAAEREWGNPICGVCNQFPTNHFCSFLLPNKKQCGAPDWHVYSYTSNSTLPRSHNTRVSGVNRSRATSTNTFRKQTKEDCREECLKSVRWMQ